MSCRTNILGSRNKLSFLLDCRCSKVTLACTFAVGAEVVVGEHLLSQELLDHFTQLSLTLGEAQLQVIEDIEGNGFIVAARTAYP